MKKFHLADKEALQFFRDIERKEKERKQKYGDIKPIIQAEVGGVRAVGIGSRLYYSDKWITFPDFLYDYIMIVFGKQWFNNEMSKKGSSLHPVMSWRYSIHKFTKHHEVNDEGLYSAIPSGPYKAYITLAYDLYLLEHHMKLQETIINRLKIVDQFQGARYELFVASTMIRAGYDLDFEIDKKKGSKIVEFLATHNKTGDKIAIEAKSRHRPGILGHPGEQETPKSIRIRLGQLINNAISKKPDYPFFIFIDMNLPPEKITNFNNSGINEMIKSLKNVPKTDNGEDYFNLILYTNFPYHYGDELKSYPKDHLSVAISVSPIHLLPNKMLLENIQVEVKKYGRIPNSFEENN